MPQQPAVAVIMGSQSDWEFMRHAMDTLEKLGIACESRIMSAHRTPDRVVDYVAPARERGLKVIIAGAGGAAALPGVCAAYTALPVIGVPLDSSALGGIDALHAIVQMPPGVPVATMAVGSWGARNAAVFAAQVLALSHDDVAAALKTFRDEQANR
jgi:5-(carboxyamino)imidazole ribonucleotide mutase